jgi:hypothetical protein
LSGAVSSFALVEEVLRRVGRIEISRSSIWRCTQAVGAKFQAIEGAVRVRANALPEPWAPAKPAARPRLRMGVAMDGATVHIRKEGWKEMKMASLFDIALAASQDKATGELVEMGHAVNSSYVAHLGGPEVLGEMAWAEAQHRGWEEAQDTQVLGDGAVWIWNQAALHFAGSHQLVDWYHAKQHLTEAARLCKGEGTSSFRRWLHQQETLLYQGHAARIATELEQAAQMQSPQADALAREATYFRHNQLRMNYLEMREEEWPIGSGMIESGAKQFKARFCGPGMRWSRSGAENLLPIRSAILSRRFDQIWAAAQTLPPT